MSQDQNPFAPKPGLAPPPTTGPNVSSTPSPQPAPWGAAARPAAMPAGNLGLSVIGAAGGAAIGAAIWMAIAYFVNFEIGFVAILVGALAGWGAVALGKEQSPTVGVICAIASVIGVVGGSYGGFQLHLRSEAGRAEMQAFIEPLVAGTEGYAEMTPAEREELFQEIHKAVVEEVSYFEVLKESPMDLAYMALFGGLGLFYGYRVGSGSRKKTAGPS
jgi:hypothetical protein